MGGGAGGNGRMQAGLVLALTAYVIWGVSPLYWRLFEASAWEIVAHRGGWALIVLVPLVAVTRPGFAGLFTLQRLKWAGIGAVLIGSNWLVFIWATTHDHVLEASLGYFIGPLVNVALGVAVLGERLRRAQGAAIALAVIGVAVPIILEGRVPLIALYLAVSFSLYALVRRQLDVGGAEGLFLECLLIAPFGAVAAVWIEATGRGHFLEASWQPLLLISAGVVFTAGVLLLFILGARRLPFSTLGMLQYVSPILQFGAGLMLGEVFTPARAAAFVLIWIALTVYTADLVRHERAARRARISPVG